MKQVTCDEYRARILFALRERPQLVVIDERGMRGDSLHVLRPNVRAALDSFVGGSSTVVLSVYVHAHGCQRAATYSTSVDCRCCPDIFVSLDGANTFEELVDNPGTPPMCKTCQRPLLPGETICGRPHHGVEVEIGSDDAL